MEIDTHLGIFPQARLPLSALTAIALAGCALTLRPDEPRAIGPIEIAASGRHDACVELDPGDRVDFRFEASPATAFAISYRSDDALIEPLAHARTETDSGFYIAPEAHRYCFTWKAAFDAPVSTTLRYRLSLQRKR